MIALGPDGPDVHLATRVMAGPFTLSACAQVGVILTRDAAAVTCEECKAA